MSAVAVVTSRTSLREIAAGVANYEVEQALLGALLARNDLVDRVDQVLGPEHFADPLHGRIYDAIRKARAAGRAANCLTLRAQFEGDRALAGGGGWKYLVKLENAVVAPGFVGDYAETVVGLWRRRQVLIAAAEAAELAADGEIELGAALARLDRARGEIEGERAFGQSMADILAAPKPRLDFLVSDLIPMETVTLLSGDGSVGKSYMAMQLMAAVSGGGEWLSMPVAHGPSLGLFCEDPTKILSLRQRMICERLAIEPSALRDMVVIDRAGEESELFAPVGDNPNEVEATALWHRFAAKARNLKPVVIVLDTAADVFGGNEIVRRQVRRFVRLLIGLALELRAAMVLCAHPSVEGMRSGSGISGSTGWHNSVRSRIYVTRPADNPDSGESDPDLRVLKPMKANLGPLAREIRVRWDNGAYVREVEEGGLEQRLSRKRLQALILALVLEGEAGGLLYSASSRAPDHRYLVAVFCRRHQEFTSAAVARSMKDMLATGVLRETPRNDRRGRGLIVDPQHKPKPESKGDGGGGNAS